MPHNAQHQDKPLILLEEASLALPGAGGYVPILQKVSLRVHENETVAVTGPSGSGKTSLIMLIAGLERPTGGRVQVKDLDMGRASQDRLTRFRGMHMGIVFQSFHLIPTMTALENVAAPLELQGVKKPQARAKEALEALGLAHRLHHSPAQLSGGEQQRVAIARACVLRPALLMADEPTGNLDHDTGARVIDALFALQAEYKSTLLLITHDPALAARCGRIIRLQDGQVVNG